MGDAVLIMQSLANPGKYKLSGQGVYNADVCEAGGGITSNDALAIQKYLLGIYTKLPESYSDNIKEKILLLIIGEKLRISVCAQQLLI